MGEFQLTCFKSTVLWAVQTYMPQIYKHKYQKDRIAHNLMLNWRKMTEMYMHNDSKLKIIIKQTSKYLMRNVLQYLKEVRDINC